MKIVKGIYNEAKVFSDVIEETALAQIETLCNQEFTKNAKIRIMPDVHAGAGCTIGTTMTITDYVVPNLVGVDIGCGMETVKLKNSHIEVQKLDKLIPEKIPSGFAVRKSPHPYYEETQLARLKCLKTANINVNRAILSVGTLGGGNHFIEANKDENGAVYLVVHSGSRHLGLEVADYYQKQAGRLLRGKADVPGNLAYCEGGLMEDYLHDMRIVQRFAQLNREAMMDEMIRGMKLKVTESFTTIHNYIDTEAMILRKGAVSAKAGEQILIPINMRDGSLLCTGKGNSDWNESAPHGAGRLMSRTAAKSSFTVSEFKKQMAGIYTTSVNKETLDECPMAYKGMDDIVKNITETAKINKILKPIFNFKAGE